MQWSCVVTFVTKPASVLRVKLTADVRWPGIRHFMSCPPTRFLQEVLDAWHFLRHQGFTHHLMAEGPTPGVDSSP
ncbi:MAG TPA: hypothetical protein VGM84_05875 [Steroidobacteraceae bacterium]|jgi:hypothetical protein